MQRDRDEGPGAAVRRRRRDGDDGGRRRRRCRCRTRRRGPRPSSSAFEKETLGLYWSGHPVDRYAARSEGVRRADDRRARRRAAGRRRATTPGDPAAASRSSPTPAIGGIVAACRQLKTRKGDRMAVFTLEDAQGGVEVVVFPGDVSARARSLIETGTLVLVRGKLERDDESVADPGDRDRCRSTASASGSRARSRFASKMPADRGDVRGARRDLLAPSRRPARLVRDRSAVEPARRLRVRADVSPQIRVRPSPALIAEVEQIVGARVGRAAMTIGRTDAA